MVKREGWDSAKAYMDTLVPTGSRLSDDSDNGPFMRMYESEDGNTTIAVTGKAVCILPVKVEGGQLLFGFITQHREEEGAPVFRTLGQYALNFEDGEIISHDGAAVATCHKKGGLTATEDDIHWIGMHIGFATVITPVKLGFVVLSAETEGDELSWYSYDEVMDQYITICESDGKVLQGSSDTLQTAVFLQRLIDTGKIALDDFTK